MLQVKLTKIKSHKKNYLVIFHCSLCNNVYLFIFNNNSFFCIFLYFVALTQNNNIFERCLNSSLLIVN